jgi:hypothetical protein
MLIKLNMLDLKTISDSDKILFARVKAIRFVVNTKMQYQNEREGRLISVSLCFYSMY